MMNIVNGLVLGQDTKQKFVVIALSNGEIHFVTLPLYHEGRSTHHKDIVAKFCKEQGFSPKRDPMKLHKPIYEAVRKEVKLSVEGGGIISVNGESKVISSRAGSMDYGWPRRSVVEHCIQQAIKAEGLNGYTVTISEVKDK